VTEVATGARSPRAALPDEIARLISAREAATVTGEIERLQERA
jgi:hypothetical protein